MVKLIALYSFSGYELPHSIIFNSCIYILFLEDTLSQQLPEVLDAFFIFVMEN